MLPNVRYGCISIGISISISIIFNWTSWFWW